MQDAATGSISISDGILNLPAPSSVNLGGRSAYWKLMEYSWMGRIHETDGLGARENQGPAGRASGFAMAKMMRRSPL